MGQEESDIEWDLRRSETLFGRCTVAMGSMIGWEENAAVLWRPLHPVRRWRINGKMTSRRNMPAGTHLLETWANKQPIRPTRIHIPPSPTKRKNPLPPNPPRSPSRRRSPRMGPNPTTLPISTSILPIPSTYIQFGTRKPINNPP